MPERKEKKRTKRVVVRERRVDIVKLCAFWGIFLAAALFVASGILNLLDITSKIISILDVIAKIALLIGVGFPAYNYARGKGRIWVIIFWVALVIYIVGCVFSLI